MLCGANGSNVYFVVQWCLMCTFGVMWSNVCCVVLSAIMFLLLCYGVYCVLCGAMWSNVCCVVLMGLMCTLLCNGV